MSIAKPRPLFDPQHPARSLAQVLCRGPRTARRFPATLRLSRPLALPRSDEAEFGVVHLIGVDKDDPQGLDDYLGAKGEDTLYGSAAVDHLAFLATNLPDMHRRLDEAGCVFRERTVPSLGLHQVFVEDPSGVIIELNYPSHEATRA